MFPSSIQLVQYSSQLDLSLIKIYWRPRGLEGLVALGSWRPGGPGPWRPGGLRRSSLAVWSVYSFGSVDNGQFGWECKRPRTL